MGAPSWFVAEMGWKNATRKTADACQTAFGFERGPNLADLSGKGSTMIAGAVYEEIGVRKERHVRSSLDTGASEKKTSAGTKLEELLEADLLARLKHVAERDWQITRVGNVDQFAPFRHLASLDALFKDPKNATLRSTIGRDYRVSTDLMVTLPDNLGTPTDRALHAAVSSKLTIRSDRVQNIRYEFATLVRNRRGRLPHLVVVTAEPLPSRLISIARGTGEIDAVYHLLFEEMEVVAKRDSLPGMADSHWHKQRDDWRELVDQGRIRDYATLATVLASG
jgi:hypothetical protein